MATYLQNLGELYRQLGQAVQSAKGENKLRVRALTIDYLVQASFYACSTSDEADEFLGYMRKILQRLE